jgi:asparagine synthase (glutamine-hydrolysing)
MNGSRRVLTWSDGRQLVFGTEFAQLAAAGVPATLDESWVAERLCQVAPRPGATGLAGVERLPEGELLVAGPGARPARQVFDSLRDTVAEPAPVDQDTAAAGLRPRIERAVEATLPAGDAAGVLLGEGVDAGIVAAVAGALATGSRWDGRLLPAALVGGGAEPDWVRALEDHLDTAVLRVEAEPYDWDGWRDWAAATWDLPPRPDAAAADTLAAALVAEGAAVALGGDGGADWFGPGQGPEPRQTPLARALARLRPARAAGPGPGLVAPLWLDAGWLASLGLPELVAAAERADREAARNPDHARRWRPARRRALLPAREGLQLRLNAHGLDWRLPLHEREVVEYALGLHPAVLAGPGLVLPAAAGDLLPPAAAGLAGDPVGDALAAAGGPAALGGSRLVKEGWVDLAAAERAWEQEREAEAMWPLFALATWLEAVPAT